MPLKKYRGKRDFTKTPEPGGAPQPTAKSRQSQRRPKNDPLWFVVHKHAASHLHYDLRLEMEGVLKSWAVPKGPSLDPIHKRLAVQVEDHPWAYRNFEGEIPAGQYGAGQVIIWDEGTYELVGGGGEKAALTSLHQGEIKIIFYGQKLRGEFVLVKFGGRGGDEVEMGKGEKNDQSEKNNWLLIKKADQFATTSDILEQAGSVRSDQKEVQNSRSRGKAGVVGAKPKPKVSRSIGKKSAFPHPVTPMLATLAARPFDDVEYLYETKLDGYRIIAEIKRGQVKLLSRNHQDYTDKFPEIGAALSQIKHDLVLDGEIVALDDQGLSQFQLLQEHHHHQSDHPILYYIFDLLYADGYDLRSEPLVTRKQELAQLVKNTDLVKVNDFIIGHGTELYELAVGKNVEGIMAKRLDSHYLSTRSSAWQKIKHLQTQEAVVAGFTTPRGGRQEFGALILGIYDEGQFHYVGHTGGGFTDQQLQEVRTRLTPLVTTKCPFAVTPPTNEPATWVKPQLVVQVKFAEWTKDRVMRQPVFLGIREDKKARQVTFEQPAAQKKSVPPVELAVVATEQTIGRVKLTSLDKIFWPDEGITKGDVVAYYQKIASTILPYLKDRPQSLNRHPDGINGEHFFQKDILYPPAWAKIFPHRSDSEAKTVHWLLGNDLDTLLYMVNLGCIELNPWLARHQQVDRPDFLLLDLDPHGVDFSVVIKVAQVTKKLLDSVRIPSFVKTSGQVGLHIVLPLGAQYTFTQTRQFAEILAGLVQRQLPDLTSIDRPPESRSHRVYLDFLQNRVGQTMAAPYSLRPFPGALVSTPLEWKEIKPGLDPARFNIKTIFPRLQKKGDLWKKLLSHPGFDMLKSLDQLSRKLG